MSYPRGLVRYSTENALNQHLSRKEILAHIVRPRILLYTAILVVIVFVAGWFLVHRIPLKVDVIRDRSVLMREADDGSIENAFLLRFMNTDEQPHRYRLSVEGLDGLNVAGASTIDVPAASVMEKPFLLQAPPDSGKKGSNPIRIEIVAEENADIKISEKAAFMLP